VVKAAVISRTLTLIASRPRVPSLERAVVEVKVERVAEVRAAGAMMANPERARVARAAPIIMMMITIAITVMDTAILHHPTAGNLARAVLATGANLGSQAEKGKVARVAATIMMINLAITVMDTAILHPPTVGNPARASLASQVEEARVARVAPTMTMMIILATKVMDTAIRALTQAGASQASQVATEESLARAEPTPVIITIRLPRATAASLVRAVQEEASLASQIVRQGSMAIRITTDITMDLSANCLISSSTNVMATSVIGGGSSSFLPTREVLQGSLQRRV